MDYSKLRAAALNGSEDEEAVTVDTRALIDKVLARYSGEWTTLRELIQNAADAQASTVRVKWETLPSIQVPLPSTSSRSELLKHVITNHTLRRLVVENDGQPFTRTDWGRLKRIAEGNPDETKIGAFGVGFYSVFADCEEPFVRSANEAMAFYWKGNALFTKKVLLQDETSRETAFVLDYRNTTTPLPNLLSVAQFLATSLTFVALQKIEFWIDDYPLLSLQKKSAPSAEVSIPRDLETTTKERLMRLQKIERTSAQIDASFMSVIGWKPQSATSSSLKTTESYGFGSSSDMPSLKSFFSRFTSGSSHNSAKKAAREEKAVQEVILEDLTKTSTSSIFLRVTTGTVSTHVTASFATELERATKKAPPRTTRLSILTSSYDETVASESSSDATGLVSKAADVFASVLPSKKPGGRVFIGFPTTQTTGAGMHISAPSVIPTVEREAIDLNARWVRTWNMELLRVAGTITRLAYANEMSDLQFKMERAMGGSTKGGKVSSEIIEKFLPEALHTLKTYAFAESTPSGHVSQIIEESFWTSFKKPSIEVYSSRGVLLTAKVRIGNEEVAKFVDGIPIILPEMKDNTFVQKLFDFGLLRDITVADIQAELEAKALNKTQLICFLKWAAKGAFSGEIDPTSRRSLFDVAVATVDGEGGNQGDIITLGPIKNYLEKNKIPPNLPMPPTTIPFAYTHDIPKVELHALGWEQLEIVPWFRFLIESGPRSPDDKNIMKSTQLAAQVLLVLSKNWENVSATSRETVVTLLKPRTVMPTKFGLKKPTEAYFQSVKLFDDLPTITPDCTHVKEKVLVALGVRKTVELETIFTRLLAASGEKSEKKWSHMELIKYLASVRNDLPPDDMKKLRSFTICPAEAGPAGMEPTKGSSKLYKVSDLFEPKDEHRQLGLPVLHWPGPPGSFKPTSQEALLLFELGLRPHPIVAELVDMMSSDDAKRRQGAMSYFTSNFAKNGYNNVNMANWTQAFLPLQGNDKKLVPPAGCYTNESATVLGFQILRRDLQQDASKFGVARDPPIAECVSRLLAKPPQDRTTAMALFTYFTARVGDLRLVDLTRLVNARFVPVYRQKHSPAGPNSGKGVSGSTALVHVAPTQCYLGTSSAYGDIFDFVDFGDANAFLFKCGARSEPTLEQLAELACDEPARLLSDIGHDRYLNILRKLAIDMPNLRKNKALLGKMKTSPWLLGSKEIPNREGGSDEDAYGAPIKQYQLSRADRIVVPDDYVSFRIFSEFVICAPEEDVLEDFYFALGARNLSHLVSEDLRIGPHSDKQDMAAKLRKHILERSKLFLYEYTRTSRDNIKHDGKWLEKNLAVEAVRSIALRRSLTGTGQSHTDKRSAAAKKDGTHGNILYITAGGLPDMFEVGLALCDLLLHRQNQQASISMESFLKLELVDLRRRGYNVDRILRAKEAEARIAEEERRKALEAEQRRIRERDQQRSLEDEAIAPPPETPKRPNKKPLPVMPGSFSPDAPEEVPPAAQQGRKLKSLFSDFSKRLGFESSDEQQEHGPSNAIEDTKPAEGKRPASPSGQVTSPAVVQQNLLNAIQSTRGHDSSQLFNPPQTTSVKEQATYCDSTSAKNLWFVAEAPNRMRVFAAKDNTTEPVDFLSGNIGVIGTFEQLLTDVGAMYAMPRAALHIFYDERGNTIAFNSKGSIFCNLRFFMQLHAGGLGRGGAEGAEARIEAAVWWWVVLAHELAHNLVSPHNSDHSYYTESFVQQYFPKMMERAAQWRGAGGDAVAPVTQGAGGAAGAAPPPPYWALPGGGDDGGQAPQGRGQFA